MKTFSVIFITSLMMLMITLLYTCQQDEFVDAPSGVRFILSPGSVQNDGARINQDQDEFPQIGEGLCDLVHAAYAKIVIEGILEEIEIPIKKWDADYKTDLVELEPGTYNILSFVVYNQQDVPIFATPAASSEFGAFVAEPLPLEFAVSIYEKSALQIEVLCVENFTPPQFGFSFWNIGLKTTRNLCIFGNYCEPASGHLVAEMEAWIYPDAQHTTATDLIWTARTDTEDENPNNNLLCLKFPYDPEIPASEQTFYVMLRSENVFLTATLSLAEIDKINEMEGYLHLNKNCQENFEPFQISEEHRVVIMEDPDLSIHYRVIGDGPVNMVFVPGWTNPLTAFTKQFEYFNNKARSIYIDLPGHGKSDAPIPGNPLDPGEPGLHYTMELMTKAVHAVIEKEGWQKFVAVGFSIANRVWGLYEKSHPGMISKLVNLDGGFNPWPEDPVEREKRQNIREATYLAQLEWDINAKKGLAQVLVPPGSPADLQEFVQYFWYYPSDILANIRYYFDAENANEPVGWTYPKLCLYSNPNPNMDKVNWIFPNNTTYSYPGGGHVIQWVFHEEINPLIWEFVKD
ncbi:MAG: alpha/beta fold hydrolase [Candidatus Cyclobacteriaceae bacterium M3_2C_046]